MNEIEKHIEQEIDARFEIAKRDLIKLQAVPFLIIGAFVGETPMRGNMFTMNFQGRSEREVMLLLRSVADDMEKQLQ